MIIGYARTSTIDQTAGFELPEDLFALDPSSSWGYDLVRMLFGRPILWADPGYTWVPWKRVLQLKLRLVLVKTTNPD